jgi:hypothetical protein
MPEEGHPIHYSAVERGTPVYGSDGVEVGRVRSVLDNHREHILDGFVFVDGGGKLRFVDGPEVARTAEKAVVLNIDAEAARALGPPEGRHRGLGARLHGGLGRLFGSGR